MDGKCQTVRQGPPRDLTANPASAVVKISFFSGWICVQLLPVSVRHGFRFSQEDNTLKTGNFKLLSASPVLATYFVVNPHQVGLGLAMPSAVF